MSVRIGLQDKNWESLQVSLISGVGKTEGEENMSANLDFDLSKTANQTEIFVCMLKACGSIGAIEKGKQIHENILRIHI